MSLDWVRKYGIDGFLCDVAWGPQERNSQFWVDWRAALKSIKPDILLLGEAYSNDCGFDSGDNRAQTRATYILPRSMLSQSL